MEFDKYGHKGDTLVCPYYPDARMSVLNSLSDKT